MLKAAVLLVAVVALAVVVAALPVVAVVLPVVDAEESLVPEAVLRSLL